ncbi:MAG TPA: hypothetical protein VGN15_05625, partial [Ktedonobacteraceae bacterium]|nr:hypothetical protein [Ktedonobacteraceae bacterium]
MSSSTRPGKAGKLAKTPARPAVNPSSAPNASFQPRGQSFKRSNAIGASFGSALEALWANRLRSLLTGLGIFIGV